MILVMEYQFQNSYIRRVYMDVQQSLDLNLYTRILKYNRKTPDRIEFLKKEYINYMENNVDDISDELKIFLKFLDEKQEKHSKSK